ncbi:MAG: amino acid permease [Pseudomonadota bacterium]
MLWNAFLLALREIRRNVLRSILTILGVIMYMRLGWIVGNSGLIGAIVIIVIAHVISVATGLSVSSVATDKKIGAGGIYYILSRSMGIPIGGSIGIALFIGTAFSIALYLIGFAESFNAYFGFGISINNLRITGTIALLALTALAFISTSVALKIQFIILGAIVVSLISIFFGSTEFTPAKVNLFSSENAVSLEVVFAVFFPAVTGFTAGIAMSGDLEDPKRSIPRGTLFAIGVGLLVYLALAVFMAYTVDSEVLKTDYNILMKIALFAPVVVAGIWGATLSSALGGILGGPRILQAMSIDKVTPSLFGQGKGTNNEPVNALILAFIIAEVGILIGELDIIARVVSMFYLTAYGFINISFFLESWANPDFRPTFKVKRWIGLIGFIACFAVMFKLDTMAMIAALAVISVMYFGLQRKEVKLQSNDVWKSVWENVVSKGLKKIDAQVEENSNWNPNIILFSGKSDHQSYLVELCKTVSGRTGIVTNFKLILDRENNKPPLKKIDQVVRDDMFQELGIFARQIKVDNIYSGITNIASTFGFSGVEPNTIMMGWPKGLEDSKEYSKMTQTLLHLDYNLLYLDFDRKSKFGNYRSVDFWWRETDSKNAEMMLNIARFIIASPKWNGTNIRVLFVNNNNNNVDVSIIESKISKLVEDLRVNVEIKIINNAVEQKPFYNIIIEESKATNLTIVGIPDYNIEKQAEFVLKTNNLFESIGSTLLVKAAHNFNELDLDLGNKP